jgi:peptidoglycan/LPS O-acetylase OafA/YrhL
MERPKIVFPNLDGLRFFSFLIVFLTHSFATDSPAIKQSDWYRYIKVRMFSDEDLGVSFFFVLSGFLITYLLLKEREHTGKIHVGAFYMRRSLRIWPLYYFTVFFGFVIFPLLKSWFGQVPHETADPVLCSLFLNNINHIKNGLPDSSSLAVLWSVAIEEQFYLFWPLLFFRTPIKYYPWIISGIIVFSTAYRFLFYGSVLIDYHTFGVIADMGIGGLGAYLSIYNKRFQNGIAALPKAFIVLLYSLLFVFLCFKKEIFSTSFMIILKPVILSVLFILVILEQNFCANSLFKVGRWKLISRLGKYTYGLYCLHGIAILVCATLLHKFLPYGNSWQIWLLELPASLLLSIGMSWFSFTYFESPFLKLKSRFSF